MTTRVQKGGPIFRPIVKSRARAAEVARQPSAPIEIQSTIYTGVAEHDDPASTPVSVSMLTSKVPIRMSQSVSDPSEMTQQISSNTYVELLSHTTLTPSSSQTFGEPSGRIADESQSRTTPPLLLAGSRETIPIIAPRRPPTLTPASPITAPINQGSLETVLPSSADHAMGSSPNPNPTVLTYAESDPAEPIVSQVPIEEPLITHKAKRRKDPPSTNDVEDETEPPRKKSKKRSSGGTPRLRRSRAPSLPVFEANADPGEDIDPTVITMATLCSDTGQGRISSKAIEIQQNHASWKAQNREKRARMRALMELKKYGREEEDETSAGQGSNQDVQADSQVAVVEGALNAVMSTTTEENDGFDYSQGLSMSRFNVQVRIGPNGETIIDEESLVVDRAEGENTESYTHVVESDTTKFVNSGTYGKRFRGSRWSAEETEMFYDALSQYGENYELIAYVLPGRDRKSCKNKFKAEDKKNHARIDYCLKNSIPVDIKTLSRMTGKDFSGPTPEIRAPASLPRESFCEEGPLPQQQKQTRKKSRSKSIGAREGEVIIGDRDTFDSS